MTYRPPVSSVPATICVVCPVGDQLVSPTDQTGSRSENGPPLPLSVWSVKQQTATKSTHKHMIPQTTASNRIHHSLPSTACFDAFFIQFLNESMIHHFLSCRSCHPNPAMHSMYIIRTLHDIICPMRMVRTEHGYGDTQIDTIVDIVCRCMYLRKGKNRDRAGVHIGNVLT